MGICAVVSHIMDEKVNVGFDFDRHHGLVKIIFHGFLDLFIFRAMEACAEENKAVHRCMKQSWFSACSVKQREYWNCYRKATVSSPLPYQF